MSALRIGPGPGVILLGVAVASLSSLALAEGDDSITPYRPSVSSPAQLPVPGQLELELGGVRQRSDGVKRDSVPYQFKLAFSREWGLLLGGEARIAVRDGIGRTQGLGDTNLVLKRAWELDDTSAAGIELGIKLPTAGNALGSGRIDSTVNAIYSKDLGAIHMDANLNGTRIGAVDPGTDRMQTGVSISFSAPLSERWGAIMEVSASQRRGTEHAAQLLGAVTFSPSKRLTLDAGVVRAAHPKPGATSVFAGVVFPVTRFW